RPPGAGEEDFAYLLVQLGFHLARQFGERLAPLGLEPRHAGLLTRLAAHEGLSQQALGGLLGLTPTPKVLLVDALHNTRPAHRPPAPPTRPPSPRNPGTRSAISKPPETTTKTRSAPP